MAKGIIYLMSTSLPGVTMIGNVPVSDYVAEIEKLNEAEYAGLTNFSLIYSSLMEGYTQRCAMIRNLILHRRIGETNLYTVEAGILTQLLSSMTGEQIYPAPPKTEDITETLRNATIEGGRKENWGKVPAGTYFLSENRRLLGHIDAAMYVEKGMFVVKAGSQCFPSIGLAPKIRERAVIESGVLREDVVCRSPSAAASLVMGRNFNGWLAWKDINDIPINVYRVQDEAEKRTLLDTIEEYLD